MIRPKGELTPRQAIVGRPTPPGGRIYCRGSNQRGRRCWRFIKPKWGPVCNYHLKQSKKLPTRYVNDQTSADVIDLIEAELAAVRARLDPGPLPPLPGQPVP